MRLEVAFLREAAGLSRPPLFASAITYLLLCAATQDEIVDEFHRGVVHLDVESFHFIGEVVVRPHRRHGDEKAERRGYQRFRDTAGDRRRTGSLALLDALKRAHDADNVAAHTDSHLMYTA